MKCKFKISRLLVVLFVDVSIKVTEKEEEMKNKEERNKSKTYKSIIDQEQGTRFKNSKIKK